MEAWNISDEAVCRAVANSLEIGREAWELLVTTTGESPSACWNAIRRAMLRGVIRWSTTVRGQLVLTGEGKRMIEASISAAENLRTELSFQVKLADGASERLRSALNPSVEIKGPPIPPVLLSALEGCLTRQRYPGWTIDGVIQDKPGELEVHLTRRGDLLVLAVLVEAESVPGTAGVRIVIREAAKDL